MSGRAENERVVGQLFHRQQPKLLTGDDPDVQQPLLPSKKVPSDNGQQSVSVGRIESVMSSRAPRIQNLSNGTKSSSAANNSSLAAASKSAESAATDPVTPVPTLDPVHRQKIIQLRLQAAKASMNRGRSFRRENVSRLAFWLLRTTLWLAGIFSLTILVVSFPLAVDPALESNWRSFSDEPLMCLTSDIQIQHSRNADGSVKGNDACTWTSCRQGCTGELFRCIQLFVNVSRVPWHLLNSTNTTTPWQRDEDSLSVQKTGRRPKRAPNATNWAISWAKTSEHSNNKSSTFESNHRKVNPLHEIQRANARRQFFRLLNELSQQRIGIGDQNNTSGDGKEDLFQATNVRLMINVRGCGYIVDCVRFQRTAGVIGSLFPCHLSSRGDAEVAVVEHNPVQDEAIIFYLMTVPACVFSSAVFLLCCIQHQCCWPRCVSLMSRPSPVEYSVARLAINSGQFGGRFGNQLSTAPNSVPVS